MRFLRTSTIDSWLPNAAAGGDVIMTLGGIGRPAQELLLLLVMNPPQLIGSRNKCSDHIAYQLTVIVSVFR
jgi:hypothetical protein